MKVLIVDDHPIVVSGCRALFTEADAVTVLAASTAAEAGQAIAGEAPDVIVVDINLPDLSGFELTRRILAQDAGARVLVFSMNDDPIYAAQAISCGARGYISKNDDPAHFRKALMSVAAGEVSLAPGMAERIAALPTPPHEAAAPELSPRELEILRLLANGRSMSEIAGIIAVSYKTVAGQCAALRQKLNARTPVELVRIAMEKKIV